MNSVNGSPAPAAADGPDGRDALERVAVAAAKVVAKRADGRPGDWVVIIRGTITDKKVGDDAVVEGLGWEWFWRPPAERSEGPSEVRTGRFD